MRLSTPSRNHEAPQHSRRPSVRAARVALSAAVSAAAVAGLVWATMAGADSRVLLRGASSRNGSCQEPTITASTPSEVATVVADSTQTPSPSEAAARARGSRAKEHAKAITALGVRRAGRAAERRAGKYVTEQFSKFGYADVKVVSFTLKDGRKSRNVIAVKHGASASGPIVIVGAHIDSRADKRSPGGNDNASGVGVMLEAARVLASIPLQDEVWFVAFGAEEIYDGNPDHHHAGSRRLAKSLTSVQMKRGIHMVNLDMVGVGERFQIGTQSGAPARYARYHIATARSLGHRVRFVRHGSGSDHEAFVKRGIPVAYYDRVTDKAYHTRHDTARRLSPKALVRAARVLIGTLVREAAR